VSRIRRLLSVLVVAAVLPIVGCFNPFRPQELTGGVSTPPPTPDTPSNTLRLLEWCYNNRAIAEYRELFTSDYRFQFGALDPYGNAYQDQNPWTREDELASATKLFQGSTDKQAAASITLALDPNFRVQRDPRPGKDPRWHKTIRTNVQLTILDVDQVRTDVSGTSLFFLVRGDSALIPLELVDRGFGPDSTRWYIDRWEDESVISPAIMAPDGATDRSARRAAPDGAQPHWVTWGYVKILWR